MNQIKKIIAVVLNIIIVSVIATLAKSILEGWIADFKMMSTYEDTYPLRFQFLIFAIISSFIFLLYKLLFKVLMKSITGKFAKGTITAFAGILLFSIFSAFIVGPRVSFTFDLYTLKGLLPIFLIGFIIPFLEAMINSWFRKK